MKERQLAICDKDELYLERIQSYLLKKRPAGYEILVFSAVKQAVEASREDCFEILLVGENTYDDNVTNINAMKTFILQENGQSGIRGYTFISKYQSMDSMIGQVLDEVALDEGCASAARRCTTGAKLISFYSPDRHCGQTAASLCAGGILADSGKKVLYISLSPFSGFEEILGIRYESDITDFMYFVIKQSDKLAHKLESIKRTIGRVDYLPPALDFADLADISGKDWKKAFDTLLCESGYTYVVVDLTECCKGFYHILDISDRIYIPHNSKWDFSQAALDQFKNLLLSKEYGKIIEKIKVFDLCGGWERCMQVPENLSVSPLGIYMKGVMNENGD